MNPRPRVIVFLGPTLAVREARGVLDADYRGPVSQGEVYRAVADPRAPPLALGIVDGYFARVPAVWHKEILWAIDQGVHVFGASSMGALRAAELHSFGMRGVGTIFEAFRDGVLEDDDEVTVSHGGPEMGFPSLSVAMVDIRATLLAAAGDRGGRPGVLSDGEASRLIAIAKAMHYVDRRYPAVLRAAGEAGFDPSRLEALQGWLATPGNTIHQKRDDALALLRALATLCSGQSTTPAPRLPERFEHTDAWVQVTATLDRTLGAASVGEPRTARPSGLDRALEAALIDELRLAGLASASLDGALARSLADLSAERHEFEAGEGLLAEVANEFFLRRGQLTPEQIQTWLDTHELDTHTLLELLRGESKLRWAQTLYGPAVHAKLIDQLRASGHYGPLLVRAREKVRVLEARGLEAGHEHELDPGALVAWFARRLWVSGSGLLDPGLSETDALEPAVCARMLGFDDHDQLLRALTREHHFVTWLDSGAPGDHIGE